MHDPFGLLGVAPDASLDEVRAARRRLAMALHPDRPGGGDARAMGEVNRAFDHAVKAIRARAGRRGQREGWGCGRHTGSALPLGPALAACPSPSDGGQRSRGAPPRRSRWVEHDTPSFTVGALPAEAFEVLLVATTWLGELSLDEPPYALEALLDTPGRCWCRLELVPEAGASTVSVSVAGVEDGPWPPPTAEQVRDAWVGAVNQLAG